MSLGLVLVIDDDEWVGRLLAVALRESGYEVMICGSAVEGFEKAVEVQPDCIICDVDLPDVDGFWVARKIRMASSRVSVTPFLFLSGLDDRDTRIQGFHVGADVYMTKPFRIDEVVAQVGALVQMVSRLRQNRNSFLSLPPTDAAMVGDLAQMSIATVLTLLDMERRSGKLEISSKEEKAILIIVSGAITSAVQGGEKRDPLELLRTLLTWNSGRFAFRPDDAHATPQHDNSINALLMEAVRLEDETRASMLDPNEVASTSLPGDRRNKLPDITMPPASEPSESTRIADALASTFASSVPPATPPAGPAMSSLMSPPINPVGGIRRPAIKESGTSSPGFPSGLSTPAPAPTASVTTPSPAFPSPPTPALKRPGISSATTPAASGLADRAPPFRPAERKSAITANSNDLAKPKPPLAGRITTPGPMPAVRFGAPPGASGLTPPPGRAATPAPFAAVRPSTEPKTPLPQPTRAQTPSPFAAVRPSTEPKTPLPKTPLPQTPLPQTPLPQTTMAEQPDADSPPISSPPMSLPPISVEVEGGWSEPPPAPTATEASSSETDESQPPARPLPPPMGGLTPPPAVGSSPNASGPPRPGGVRGTPARTVPLPNPRVGQGSGEK